MALDRRDLAGGFVGGGDVRGAVHSGWVGPMKWDQRPILSDPGFVLPEDVVQEIKALSSAAMGQRETTGGESERDSHSDVWLSSRGGGSLSKGGSRPDYYWREWK